MVVATGFESFELQKKDMSKMNSNYRQNQYISRMNSSTKDTPTVFEDKDDMEFEDETEDEKEVELDNNLDNDTSFDDYDSAKSDDDFQTLEQNSEYDIPAFLRKKMK
jgi:hypothetical protein